MKDGGSTGKAQVEVSPDNVRMKTDEGTFTLGKSSLRLTTDEGTFTLSPDGIRLETDEGTATVDAEEIVGDPVRVKRMPRGGLLFYFDSLVQSFVNRFVSHSDQ